MKRFYIIVLILIITFSLSSCGSKKMESANNAGGAGVASDMVAPSEYKNEANKIAEAKQAVATEKAVETDRKIIYTASSIINVKDINKAHDSIVNKTKEFGGYVANSNIRDQNSQLTVRIPAIKLDEFLKFLDTLGGEIKESSISTNDITDQYTDVKSRLRNLKVQEEQLIEIMKKANTVEDILKIQAELFRVRGEIEALEGKINMWDKLIEYSTVNIKLNKIQEIGQKDVKISLISFSEIIKGMSNGFKTTLNIIMKFFAGTFIFAVSLLPVIPFIALIIWIIMKIRKRSKKDINL